jgi:hypothetical protein
MYFRSTVLQKGIDPENAAVPEALNHSNGTTKASHANVPLGSTSMDLMSGFGGKRTLEVRRMRTAIG